MFWYWDIAGTSFFYHYPASFDSVREVMETENARLKKKILDQELQISQQVDRFLLKFFGPLSKYQPNVSFKLLSHAFKSTKFFVVCRLSF